MRILITGGAGFQGSRLAESLLAKKHQITILNTPSDRALLNIKKIKPKVKVVWGSVTDPEIVYKSVRDQDVVFHLAAYINVDESILNPEKTIYANVIGTTNVLNAIKENKNRLIFVSSCEVYGDGHKKNVLLSETAELRPNSPYAASKAAADRICHSYFKSFGTDVTIVRPFNIFGERQRVGKFGALIPILIERAISGKDLTVFGDGKQTRDYVYIDDMIAAYSLVLRKKNLSGKVINFATGENTRVIDIAKYIAKKFNIKVIHGPARPGEVNRFRADISLARSLGWKPRVSIWDGIDRYIAWRLNEEANDS